MNGESGDRRSRLLEHASEVRSRAQETMATVASAALALSVTFRGSLAESAPGAVWLLRFSWIGLTICIATVIAERIITSMRMTVHAVQRTSPAGLEKHVMGAPHLISMIAFVVGIGTLTAFGFANLGSPRPPGKQEMCATIAAGLMADQDFLPSNWWTLDSIQTRASGEQSWLGLPMIQTVRGMRSDSLPRVCQASSFDHRGPHGQGGTREDHHC